MSAAKNRLDRSPKLGESLLENLIRFGRYLRELGIEVGTSRLIGLVEALGYVNIGRREDFYFALRSLLVRKQEQIAIFDRAFATFWMKTGSAGFALNIPQGSRSTLAEVPTDIFSPGHKRLIQQSSRPPSDDDSQHATLQAARTYSPDEILRRKDFAEMTDEEMQDIIRLMASFIWSLGSRKTRRKQPGWGSNIDFRRSLRSNIRFGGEFLYWSRREPKFKPRPLVVVADISGSMEQYTRMLLHFAYFLYKGHARDVEVFVFGTRLSRITRQLSFSSVDDAIKEISNAVPDWSGGTRIGEAIKTFNYNWARRSLGRGAVVLLISDGWDRGDPNLLRKEIARLQRSCHRLVWLNPLLGSPDYEPLTQGMKAALPFVDDFLPAHNMESLEDLAALLARLEKQRPANRNQKRSSSSSSRAAFGNQHSHA